MGVASTYNPANNDKYVSVDGHIEGVYDENGNLVTDPVNQGTYNFANPNILDISLKMLYHTTYGIILLMTLHHFGKELQEHILAMLMESRKCYLNLFFLWLSYFLLLSSQ